VYNTLDTLLVDREEHVSTNVVGSAANNAR